MYIEITANGEKKFIPVAAVKEILPPIQGEMTTFYSDGSKKVRTMPVGGWRVTYDVGNRARTGRIDEATRARLMGEG